LTIFQEQKVNNIFIEFLQKKKKQMWLGPYAGRGRESSPCSLRGAGQVRGGVTRFAIPTFCYI